MKKVNTKLVISCGAACALLMGASSWHAVKFNHSRLVAPMDFSQYTFQPQDLPMIISIALVILYVLYLFGLLARAIITNKHQTAAAQFTRTMNPKLGYLGFLGFAGLLGFWTYHMDKTIFPFVFFMFFGFFGFFYEGKMSNTFMDERYRENKMKAHMAANKIALSIIFVAMLILGQGKLMGNLEYTLIALITVVAFSIALELFLSEYLLYRYDHDQQFEGSEE